MTQPTTPQLGTALKNRRKSLGLNLIQLSELSSVSRSMLSEIERGNANPTFTTLWNITRALGISIDELTHSCFETQSVSIEHQTAQTTPYMLSEDQGCKLRALNPIDTATEFEWYELTINPGSKLDSAAHSQGTREHLSVIEGTLQVQLEEAVESQAIAGETLRYPADIQHRIENTGAEPARAFLVVHKIG